MIYLLTIERGDGYYLHHFYYQNEVVFIKTYNFHVNYTSQCYKYIDGNKHRFCSSLYFKIDAGQHIIVQYSDIGMCLPEYVNNFVLNKILENV